MDIYIRQKRYDEAAQAGIENAVRLGATEAEAKNEAWYKVYRQNGFRGWMQYNISINEKQPDILLRSYNQSLNYAHLGDKEKTLAYLEKCFAGHAFMLPFANARPEYDFLRDDARFQDLMRQAGLNN